jgi:parvulin-like peptidyl-prolyl isomerase
MPLHLRSAASFAARLSLCLLLCAAPRLRAADDTTSVDDGATVVARVGDSQVTLAEVRAALQNQNAQVQAAVQRDPSALSQVVRMILAQRLVLKEALAKKWDQNPAVTAALDQLRNNAIAQTYLQSVSVPPKDFPTDAQVQAAYDANKSKLLVAKQYDLAQIYVHNPKGASEDDAAKAQVKLEAVRKALRKEDADFSAVATAESDDPTSAAKGGELGWVAVNRIQPEIASQIGKLGKGSVSQPIRLDDGWHILKVLDLKPEHTPTLEEIHDQLVQTMRSEQARANSQQYLAQLLKDNPVQIDELSLSKVFKAQP